MEERALANVAARPVRTRQITRPAATAATDRRYIEKLARNLLGIELGELEPAQGRVGVAALVPLVQDAVQ